MVSIRTFCLLAVILLLPSCERIKQAGSLDDIRERGRLIILTRNAPTTFYEGRDGLEGIDHDMAVSFAEFLGVRPHFRVKNTVSQILESLAAGGADLAAAGLTRTRGRTEFFMSGPAYQEVKQQVVCRRGGKRPRSVKDLYGINLTVVARSSYAERLEALKEEKNPDLAWKETDRMDTEQLLEDVWEGKLDCTVADSNIVAINRRYYPELVVAFNLAEPQPLAWLMPPGSTGLQQEMEAWFREYKASGALAHQVERYYGFIEIFDYVDTTVFIRKIDKVLPKYKIHFHRAAREHDLSWTLLAAQAYQESRWDPGARSPTGVEGIMMLTEPTAEAMGVKDRKDPQESIMGGAKYLARIKDRLPKQIQGQERTWFALAAYNVGMAHLNDARKLARRLDKDPDRWRDMAKVLPLLSQKKYYKTLRHGYARGSEPVRYVNRVRAYRNILERNVR